MTGDARFEDGGERPLNLGALDAEDLQVISSLVQDAVLTGADMQWEPRRRRLSLLVNRMRWEDTDTAARRGRPPERVRAVLVIENVMKVASQGVRKGDADTVLSVLALGYDGNPDAGGTLEVTLAGDGAIRAQVEALEVQLKDVTRPYVAPSRKAPKHPD